MLKKFICTSNIYLTESKYQFFMNSREKVGINKLKNPKVFTDCSHANDDGYENLEDYSPTKKRKV